MYYCCLSLSKYIIFKLLSSVAQLWPTLCDPMNRSTSGLPVHHQLPEFTQTRVHRVGDAIQPSHPLLSPSPPAPNPSQHQGLFKLLDYSRLKNFQIHLLSQRYSASKSLHQLTSFAEKKKITLQCFMQRFFLDEDIESLQNIFSWNLFALYILGKKEKNLNSECKFHSKFHCQSAFYIFLFYLYLLWHPTTQLWPNSDLNSCNDLLNGLFFTIMCWLIKFLLFPLFSLLASISFHLFQMWTEFLRTRAISKLLFM